MKSISITFEEWLLVLNSEQEAFHTAFVRVPLTTVPEPEETRRQRVDAYREELLARGFAPGEIEGYARRAWGRDAWTRDELDDWRERQDQKTLERGILA